MKENEKFSSCMNTYFTKVSGEKIIWKFSALEIRFLLILCYVCFTCGDCMCACVSVCLSPSLCECVYILQF